MEHPHWFSTLDDMSVWKIRDSLVTLDEDCRVNPYDAGELMNLFPEMNIHLHNGYTKIQNIAMFITEAR